MMYFVVEESEETLLNFSPSTVLYKLYYILIFVTYVTEYYAESYLKSMLKWENKKAKSESV